MSRRSLDILIVGEDLAALWIAAVAAATGRSVVWAAGVRSPLAMARPLPLPEDPEWTALRAVVGLDESAGWLCFGGSRAPGLPRATPIGDGRTLLLADRGAWRRVEATAGDAWVEPANGWPAWIASLEDAAYRAGVTTVERPAKLRADRGILRRAVLRGLPAARRVLVVEPPAGRSGPVDWPGAWPRSFGDDGGAWWSGAERAWLHVVDEPQRPPGWEGVTGAIASPQPLPWGVVDCRGMRVVSPPSPAIGAPGPWLAWLVRQLRWLGIGRRDVGKVGRLGYSIRFEPATSAAAGQRPGNGKQGAVPA